MHKDTPIKDSGLRKLIKQGREQFRLRENTQYYSTTDYREAEKKFVKLCVLEGKCGSLLD